MSKRDDDLAYGDPPQDRGPGSEGADRSIVGDTFNFLKSKYKQSQHPQPEQNFGYTEQPAASGNQQYSYNPTSYNPGQSNQPSYPGGPPPQASQPKTDTTGSLLGTLHGVVHGVGQELAGRFGTKYDSRPTAQNAPPAGQLDASTSGVSAAQTSQNKYGSFAPERAGNDVKWYVDGCGYMYAVSQALEAARESIWILDWWLSPELYLRRPPSKNEQYRVDRMLQAAAQRGVRVNIIVYKEVTQALTRKYLTPIIPPYLHSLLPRSTDVFTSTLVMMGLLATTTSLEYLEEENPLISPPLTVCSSHTKHALENLHPNIAVFRHPDHLPDAKNIHSSLVQSVQNMRLDAAGVSKLGIDTVKGIYGMNDDVILYWAHHEKLCLIDGRTAFMGGLDLCYGRWDTTSHPIADVHPHDLNATVFSGQDYNNARVMDFADVPHWENNKLDRRQSSRMGWSDISVSLHGSVVQDLRRHFIDRWNFIFDEKYTVRKDVRYSKLSLSGETSPTTGPASSSQPTANYAQQSSQAPSNPAYGSNQAPQFPPPPKTPQYGSNSGSQFAPPPTTEYPPSQALNQPTQQQSSFSDTQQEQYYPPPPSGPPPAKYGAPAENPDRLYESRPTEPVSFSAELEGSAPQQPGHYRPYRPPTSEQSRGFDEDESFGQTHGNERGLGKYSQDGRRLKDEVKGIGQLLYGRAEQHLQHGQEHYSAGSHSRPVSRSSGSMPCQIIRSCAKWSNGSATEHSIQNAYIDVIQRSQRFVYIENQFFITATGDQQKPVKNQIGKALVERIIRAARAREPYKVIVIMPSVPAFAGDLKDEGSLGTRAIMEFQYNSINRGPHSIMEMLNKEGINPMEYIRFYNLRSYDRINVGAVMQQAEAQGGASFEDARKQHDDAVGAGYGGEGEGSGGSSGQFQQYQQAAQQVSAGKATGSGRWDSVSECYMLDGADIRQVPWDAASNVQEIDAFVSEQLYVHSKVLIADDRIVICGSANLNDRSQLGYHDSEIALIIEDPTPVQSTMAGQPWKASRFAAGLRRFLFRKHLGLVRSQDPDRPDENFYPVGTPNNYDWGSAEDDAVADPLSETFQGLWNSRARTNTEVFRKVFHAVPDDNVRNWNDYKEFYEYYFHKQGGVADAPKGQETPARYFWGHVVKDDFSPGETGTREVKDWLSRVKGTLVEMPLMFLIEEDIAQEGTTLNGLTEEVYT